MNFLKSLPKQKLQKVVLAAVGTLVALGVIGNFYISNQWSAWSENRERVTKLKKDITEAEAQIRAEADSEALRGQMLGFVNGQQEKMVSGDSFSWVVRELNLLAEKYPIKELSLQPGAKTPGSNNHDLYVTHLSFDSTYDGVGRFIQALENEFPLSRIRNLTVSASGVPEPGRACHAVIEIALLMRPADAPKVAKAEPDKSAKKPDAKDSKKVDSKKVEAKKT